MIDEVCYFPLDSLAANLFFQVVRGMNAEAFCSYECFVDWGELLLGDSISNR
ncbi:hypothetical protein [Thermoactinomyces mirandus]|uniref:hypothetical protein n=1 Tax=Thermoactinomyces mirandus TaxID=2756294 RepID=UPI001C68C38D